MRDVKVRELTEDEERELEDHAVDAFLTVRAHGGADQLEVHRMASGVLVVETVGEEHNCQPMAYEPADLTNAEILAHYEASLRDGESDEDDEPEPATADDVQQWLLGLIDGDGDGSMFEDENGEEREVSVLTFEDVGLMTRDRGLVITVGDREFQVTIVRSR